ncbi:MAG: ParA family protein [Dehalococcoidia bacterium]
MTAQVVALVNQKGGVGKTTTAVSLSAALARHDRRALLIDLDPQCNATSAAGVPVDASGASVYEVLLDGLPAPEAIVELPEERFALIPATRPLAGAEVELVPVLARERRLAEAVNPLRDRFDWIFLDCPPSLGLLTVNALTAADGVIIPVQCEYLALEGLGRLTQTLELVRHNLNPRLRIIGVVLTMFDARTRLAAEVVQEVRDHFGETFATVIPRSVRLGEAPSHGLSIFRYEPSGRAAAAYEALADELLSRKEVHS